jgi:TonB family protein
LLRDLVQSSDAALLGATARELVKSANESLLNHQGPLALDRACPRAVLLLQRAIVLDPENREWLDLLEGVRRLPCTSPLPRTTPELAPQTTPELAAGLEVPERLTVSAGFQASKLLQAPAPAYPEQARKARIQGVVKFEVLIGTDGHVKNLSLLSGHPLLVDAAREALVQYVHQPANWKGLPAEVETTVDIPFRLP